MAILTRATVRARRLRAFYGAIARMPIGPVVTLEVLGPLTLSVLTARRAASESGEEPGPLSPLPGSVPQPPWYDGLLQSVAVADGDRPADEDPAG